MDTILTSKDTIAQIQHVIKVQCEHDSGSDLFTNFITIVIALIAGLIALYQVKSNTISSARIAWIENLRDTISSYCMEITKCGSTISNMRDECNGKSSTERDKIIDKFYSEYQTATFNSDRYGSKVLLYLNSKEKEHKAIEDIMHKISFHLHKTPMKEFNDQFIEEHLDEIILNSKIIFKEEWDKSKKIFKI